MTKSPTVACRSSEVIGYNRCNYFAAGTDIHLLDRSRFATLIAVAQKIKCDTNSKSVNHVVSTIKDVNRDLVKRLNDLYKYSMKFNINSCSSESNYKIGNMKAQINVLKEQGFNAS
jgi:hypothetical protein